MHGCTIATSTSRCQDGHHSPTSVAQSSSMAGERQRKGLAVFCVMPRCNIACAPLFDNETSPHAKGCIMTPSCEPPPANPSLVIVGALDARQVVLVADSRRHCNPKEKFVPLSTF